MRILLFLLLFCILSVAFGANSNVTSTAPVINKSSYPLRNYKTYESITCGVFDEEKGQSEHINFRISGV